MEACVEKAFGVEELKEIYKPDYARIEVAKRRQAAVWRGERPDKCPILLSAPLTKEQDRLPNPEQALWRKMEGPVSPNFLDAINDPVLALSAQLRSCLSAANAGGDSVPSVRVNFGTGILLACLGLEQDFFPDKMPWLKEHMSKERIAKLTPDDIKISGSFAKGMDFMRRFKEIMGDRVAIYCMDTQGPFDLAHLLMGDELFMEIYDDPAFVHHLMELCLELGVRAHTWMKELTGEPLDKLHHSNSLYAENMGIRICEDTTTLIAPDSIAEFAMPYTRRLAQKFGGAWVHYCGRNDHLTKAICEIPEVRGINFGFIPGHEQDHVFEEDMAVVKSHGKVYFGGWPRKPGEDGASYLRRMHFWASQGCIIPDGGASLGANGLKSHKEVMELWHSL